MKICNRCQTIKDELEFSQNKNYSDGLEYWCRICKSIYAKEYRQQNIFKARKYTNDRRRNRVSWLQDLKQGKPCKDCGKIYEPYCMDFDHLIGKINSISRMTLQNTPQNKILDEIKKCDLVCVLCHNKRTQDRLDSNCINKKYSKYTLRNIEIINKAKSVSCTTCGKKYEFYNMQLDHISPNDKFKNISQLKNFKLEILTKELNKCQVLCALCHRRKSIWEQRTKQYPISRPKIEKIKSFIDFKNHIKECGVCHRNLSFDKFHKHSKTKDNLNSWCKSCINKYKREKRADH